MFYKLIMKIGLDFVGAWKVGRGGFWPHGNKGVPKRRIIGERERLKGQNELVLWLSGV
jgi:hypothetical protein